MSGYILRDSEPSIVLTADQVDRLVKNGDGDAALLYLLLMRADRGVTEQELQSRLRWSQLRLNAAEGALQRLGLIQRPAETPAPVPAEERPVYSAQDLAQLLEDDRSFRMLIPQVEEKLGRRLKTADLQILAGLYDDMGMPADVIYLLVNHCIARSEERYGPGRRPTLRQIEKEGYYWARQGLFDQDSAARYLKTWREKQQGQAAYMQVLGLGQRRPVASEENTSPTGWTRAFRRKRWPWPMTRRCSIKAAGVAVSQWDPPPLARKRLAYAGGGPAGRRQKSAAPPDQKPDKNDSRMGKYMKW